MAVREQRVERLRACNRVYTREIGVVGEGFLLRTPHLDLATVTPLSTPAPELLIGAGPPVRLDARFGTRSLEVRPSAAAGTAVDHALIFEPIFEGGVPTFIPTTPRIWP